MNRTILATKSLRSGVAALLVAGAVFSASAPAQAANLSFSLNFGNGNATFNQHGFRYDRCDSNRQIFRDLSRRGYTNIQFNQSRGNWVIVEADGYRFHFVWRVNRCNGEVWELSRQAHRWGRGPGHGGGNWGGNGGGHHGGGGNWGGQGGGHQGGGGDRGGNGSNWNG